MKKKIYALLIFSLFGLGLSLQAQNMGLDFDGIDDYVVTSNDINLSGAALTLEAWINADSFQSATPFISQIFGSETASNAAFLRLGDADIDKNKVQFVLYFGTSQVKLTSNLALKTNTWYHIAGTYDGSDMRIFINGDEDASVAQTGSFTSNEKVTAASNSEGARCFDGKLDELRIWNNARAETEIRAFMYKELTGNEAGLVVYYNCNATSGTSLTDNSSNSNTGTLKNMNGSEWTPSSAFFGPKSCLDFDANDDYCNKNSNVMSNTDNFTMMAWIKADAIPSDQWRCIAYNGNDAGGYGIGMLNGKLGGLFGTIAWHETTETLSTGKWYHVAMRRSSGTLKFFLNGKLLSYSSTTTPNSPSSRFSIGNMYESDDTPLYTTSFNGQIDEVRVYDAALTDAQIREVMCKTLQGDETNLVAYYNFDNTSGTKLQSFDGQTTNDLTLVSMSDDDWVASTAINTWLNTNTTTWATAANWSRESIPASNDNVGVYNHTGSSPALSGTPTINNLYVGSDADLTLTSNATVNGNLFLNDDIDLNGKTVTLGSSAYLYETSSGHFSGSSGLIQTTRTLSNIDEDVAGLGLEITEDGNLGSTTIKRGHSTSGITSVNRYFQITSTNAPTAANMVFNYLTDELNSQTEADLKLWKSSNGTSSWAEQTSTVSTANNTISITGLNSFSYWTGATKTAPTVTTTAISSITTTTASSGGNVTSDGNQSVSARCVCWNTSTDPTTANSTTSNGTGTGSFTSSITGLSANTTYYVRAYATNASGTSYGSNENFTTNTTTTTWNGSAWSDGAPTSSIHAIINGTYNDGANFVCKNLTINSGKALTLGSGKTISVNGNLDNNGTFTIASGGSLITLGTVSGSVTAQRLLTNDSKWHLISAPNSSTTALLFDDDYLQTWNEATITWTDITSTSESFVVAKGYSFFGTHSNKTYNFTGTPTTGDQSIAITYHNSVGSNDGMNLLGNPYPSAIDWGSGDLKSSYGAVYVWDPDIAPDGAYISWIKAESSGERYIPPMQGFFIYADPEVFSFQVKNLNRTHTGADDFYKNKKSITNGIILQTIYGEYSDVLDIHFDEETSPEFELQQDALKLVSLGTGQSQMYSMNGTHLLSIDTRPETEMIQLGYQNIQSGVFEIGIKEIDGISKVVLEDTKTMQFHDLNVSNYEFAWEGGDAETRFKLHLDATGLAAMETAISQIFAYHKIINIRSSEKLNNAQIRIIDMMGRVVYTQSLVDGQNEQITTSVQDGVYMVQLVSDEGTLVAKVVLQ